jgi:hypothetical protein
MSLSSSARRILAEISTGVRIALPWRGMATLRRPSKNLLNPSVRLASRRL